MMRRFIVVFGLIMVALVGLAATAGAEELTVVLSRQGEAVYSGEQTVACNTPDGTYSEVYEVGQDDAGVVTRSGAGVYRTSRLSDSEKWPTSEGYEAVSIGVDRLLGRSVDVVEIRHDGVVRVLLSLDDETGVVLASDIFNADGSTYCSTRFTRFVPGDPGLAASVDSAEMEMPDQREATGALESTFPIEVGQFTRQFIADGVEADVLSAYYVDGLFSFTLLNSPRPIDVPELREAPIVAGAAGDYRRSFDVGSVVYSWQSNAGGYVLIGDLPLDLQDSVLADLPAAESAGFFERLWRGLFN